VSCSGGGLSHAGVEVLSATGQDAHVGEVTGLMADTSGRAGNTVFCVWGGTGTGGMLQNQRSSEEEKHKLENKGKSCRK
jgi:hypothetical protein